MTFHPGLAPGPPCAAYVHVPFCRHRCGYCNFTVVAGRDDLVPMYLDAIERELQQLGESRPVESLFLGGGTPTHLAEADLRRLLQLVTGWFHLQSTGEFSVEANPGDISATRIDLLAEFGVNRLSLGAQSFSRATLAALERDHTAARIGEAFELARRRIASLSLDLIFAAPGQSLQDWQGELAQAIALEPDHISTYGLTYEQGTTFWGRRLRGQLSEADEETQREMYLAGIETLAQAGLAQYEVSNFARSGHRCRHNQVYWSGRSYYGIGPGAARYVDGRRETNHRSTTTYLRRMLAGDSPVDQSEMLSPNERAREGAVLALRTIDGVARRAFAAQFGYDLDALLGTQLRSLVELGMLEDDGTRLRLTRAGLLVSDSIWPQLL